MNNDIDLKNMCSSYTIMIKPSIIDNRMATKYGDDTSTFKADSVAMTLVTNIWGEIAASYGAEFEVSGFENYLRAHFDELKEMLITSIVKTFMEMKGCDE